MPTRRLRLALCVALVVVACGDRRAPRAPTLQANIQRYLNDPGYRALRISASVGHAKTAYGALRSEQYARRWSALPIYDPAVASIGESAPMRSSAIDDAARAGDLAALARLGRDAFARYPAQQIPFDEAALTDGGALEFGLDPSTVVRVDLPGVHPSLTCASCHTYRSTVSGNRALDLGALMIARPAHRGPIESLAAAPFLAWGPGRVDVTTSTGQHPLRIPDLRAVSAQRYLQASGAVLQEDPIDLALRIETLLITGHHESLRPPRQVTLGIALYLRSLLPNTQRAPAPSAFVQRCAGCHAGAGLSGGLVPAARIGGDLMAAFDDDRGTGAFRVPSLLGVADRGPLLHDCSVRDLPSLLDPTRPGGHRFGLDLPSSARQAIVDWLAK